MAEPAGQPGSAKMLRIRGALAAANRWGSKSALPAAEVLGQIISPEKPAGVRAAACCGLSCSGAVSNSPKSGSRFLPAALATSRTAPNFGFPITNFHDLSWLLSSPGRTSSYSPLQPVKPPAWLRNPDQGGRPAGKASRATNPRGVDPQRRLPPTAARKCVPLTVKDPVRGGGRPPRESWHAREAGLARAPALSEVAAAGSGADWPHCAGGPGRWAAKAGGRKAWGADPSPGMTSCPRARTARPGRSAFPT